MRRILQLVLWNTLGSAFLLASPHDLSARALESRANNYPKLDFQSVTVSGKVTDEAGVGMPGVNV